MAFGLETSGFMIDGMATVDLEVARDFGMYNVTLGAQNAFDEYPDEGSPGYSKDAIGMRLPRSSSFRFQRRVLLRQARD